MSFGLRVRFTGICSFVPSADGKRYLVILPNGEDRNDVPKQGADLKEIRRHRAFVRFRVKHVLLDKGARLMDDGVTGVWYFRKRVDEGGTPGDRGYDLKFDGLPTTGSVTVRDLSHVARLEDFAPSHCTVDPSTFSSSIPDSVVGRVLLDTGTLSAPGDPADWVVFNTLNPAVPLSDAKLNPKLVSNVFWEVSGLTSLRIVKTPFGTGTQEVVQFEGKPDEVIDITVGNLCDDNPLQWGPAHAFQPDTDFRLHYELLDPTTRQNLKNLLDGRDLPFPIPKPANGLGMNCLPAITKGAF